MIDTKELRRLAQAATPGPWVSQGRYIGTPRHMSYIGEVRDQCGNWSDTEKSRADAAFISAANPAAISELLDRLEAAEKDAAHQKALAASALRVAEGWERKCGELRAKIEAMERQEPVFWWRQCSDGTYEGPIHNNSIERVRKQSGAWSPLYALPGAKGEEK